MCSLRYLYCHACMQTLVPAASFLACSTPLAARVQNTSESLACSLGLLTAFHERQEVMPQHKVPSAASSHITFLMQSVSVCQSLLQSLFGVVSQIILASCKRIQDISDATITTCLVKHSQSTVSYSVETAANPCILFAAHDLSQPGSATCG